MNSPSAALQSGQSVLSVSRLNRLARSLLETEFPAVAVEGEISNLARPASGHWYLTLKDQRAQLRCAMFRNRNRLLRFQPSHGMQVLVRGQLSLYEGRGEYQLIIDSMEEAGDGALQRAFEQLKRRLHAEGLFDKQHKQEVGSNLQHIGIITSRTGAAFRDLLAVFRRRFPAIRLTLFPVAVQGNEAAREIIKAISAANRLRDRLDLQALILSRGGGSLEDLQAFNEESVARAVFGSQLPITSAVGHEIDFTICDFVADLRAATPSAAAELMSPDQQRLLASVEGYQQQLASLIHARIAERANKLSWFIRQLQRPDRRLQDNAQNLDRLETRMRRAMGNRLQQAQGALSQRQRALQARSPLLLLAECGRRCRSELQRLETAATTHLKKRQGQLEQLTRSLQALSPLQVLARGYSITCDDHGTILRSREQARANDRIRTTLADGTIDSVVVVDDTDTPGTTADSSSAGGTP